MWKPGSLYLSAALGIFTYVAPMIWPSMPRGVLSGLLSLSILLALVWPLNGFYSWLLRITSEAFANKALLVFCSILGASIFMFTYYGIPVSTGHPENKLGVLLPGKDPSPKSPCHDISASAFAMFYGDSASYATSFPYTVLKVKGEPKIVLLKNADGGIAITMDVFDKEEDIVAQIINNEFTVNPQKTFEIKSDKSHLPVIVVRHKQEVFSITYLNPNAIKIKAVLYYPNTEQPLIITDDKVLFGNGTISGSCFYDNTEEGLHLGDFVLK